MWNLFQNDGPTANVLMHIIIYSIVYEKKNVFVFVSVALDFTFYFGIKATVKLLEKKGVLHLFWYQSTISIELWY